MCPPIQNGQPAINCQDMTGEEIMRSGEVGSIQKGKGSILRQNYYLHRSVSYDGRIQSLFALQSVSVSVSHDSDNEIKLGQNDHVNLVTAATDLPNQPMAKKEEQRKGLKIFYFQDDLLDDGDEEFLDEQQQKRLEEFRHCDYYSIGKNFVKKSIL